LDPRAGDRRRVEERCSKQSGIEPEATVVWTGRVGETADHVALLARPAWRAAAVFPLFFVWLKILASIAVDNHDLKFLFLNYRDEMCSARTRIPALRVRPNIAKLVRFFLQ